MFYNKCMFTPENMPPGSAWEMADAESFTRRIEVKEGFRHLIIPPDDYLSYDVQTVARTGCDSVVVWRINEDGTDNILITHYPINETAEHLEALRVSPHKGGGTAHATFVYATQNERSARMARDVELVIGIKPDTVHIPYSLEELAAMRERALNPTALAHFELHQLIAQRYASIKRIFVPLPGGRLAYEKILWKDSHPHY